MVKLLDCDLASAQYFVAMDAGILWASLFYQRLRTSKEAEEQNYKQKNIEIFPASFIFLEPLVKSAKCFRNYSKGKSAF